MAQSVGRSMQIKDNARRPRAFSRRNRPELCGSRPSLLEQRAQATPGASTHPWAPCKGRKHRVGPQVRPGNPGVPRADGLRLIRALPGETWLCCHRPPKRNCVCANTPATRASGLHDFAVRDAARSSRAPLASTASRLDVRDDRDTPLSEEAGRGVCTRELG